MTALYGIDQFQMGIYTMPSDRGKLTPVNLCVLGSQALPTDPVGSTTVTFSGVQSNSEIRVILPDLTEAAGIESCGTNQQLTWSVYAAGSSNNNVIIRIVHSSYKLIELPYTSKVGNVTLPIQQQKDKWYSNPV